MSETTKNRLYLMITITNRVMGATHFLDFYRAFGAPVVFTALGRGTASNDVLSYLGLEATEKSVMFSGSWWTPCGSTGPAAVSPCACT